MFSLFDFGDRLATWITDSDDDVARRVMVDFIAALCENPEADLYFVEWSVEGQHARLIMVPGAGTLVYMLDHIKRQVIVLRVCDP
jgi:hypothetical protein